jgi:hypothetical protein
MELGWPGTKKPKSWVSSFLGPNFISKMEIPTTVNKLKWFELINPEIRFYIINFHVL